VTGYLSDVVIPTGQWTHLAISYTGVQNSSTHTIWINGTAVKVTSTNRAAFGSFFVVGDGTQFPRIFDGQIDQVKIWENTLNQAQIQESMHSYQKGGIGTSIADATLRAHYDFNEFNQGVEPNRAGSSFNLISSDTNAQYTDSQILTTNTAFSSLQNVVQFNRTYLTATGGWSKPANVTNFKSLVVAGGGGGGAFVGAGGGAGGMVESTGLTITSSVLRVEVGQGGEGGMYIPASSVEIHSSQGQPSKIVGNGQTLTSALGGGRGAGWGTGQSSSTGGSGGGGNGSGSANNNWAGALGTTGQGFEGGNGQPSNQWATGGGGGAGGPGGTGSGNFAGDGGTGKASSIT
jgi:hypothetical protein